MTSAAAAQLNDFVQTYNAHTHELLGEVISWDLPENVRVRFVDLQQALAVAGLETGVARELLPRYAFSRAIKSMQEERIIRKIAESNDGKIAFQFTKEQLAQDHFDYTLETILYLEKETGHITGDNPSLVQLAQGLLAKALEDRTTADISRVIKRLFEKQADLFPVRSAGGVYFVPQKHESFVEQIDKFVTQLNGNLTRFPVPAGTKKGDKSVKAAVTAGIEELIAEHKKAVESFGDDTREFMFERQLNKIEKTGFKIEAYATYLDEERKRLEDNLKALRLQTKQKLAKALSGE